MKCWWFLMLSLQVVLLWGCLLDRVEIEPGEVFVKFYGERGTERGVDFLKTQEGYLLVGHTNSRSIIDKDKDTPDGTEVPLGESDVYVVFTDEAGNALRSFVYNNERTSTVEGQRSVIPSADEPVAVIATSDGNYLIAATSRYKVSVDEKVSEDGTVTSPPDTDQSNIVLWKISPNGNKIYQNTYGKEALRFLGSPRAIDETASGLVEVSDGYVVAGTTTLVDTLKSGFSRGRASSDVSDVYVFKISKDDNGSVLWERRHGFGGEDRAVSIVNEGDDLVLLADTENESEEGGDGRNIFFLRMNSRGIQSSARTFGRNGDENPSRMVRMSPNFYVLTGGLVEPEGEFGFMYTISGNSPATVLYTVGGSPNRSLDVVSAQATPAGYWVAGRLEEFRRGAVSKRSEMFLVRISEVGTVLEGYGDELLKGVHYGGIEDDEARRVMELPSGHVVAFGTLGFEGGSTMMCLMKCNRQGELREDASP